MNKRNRLPVKWIFFDIGSTLVDETAAYEHRTRDMIDGTDVSFEEFCSKRIEFAKMGYNGDAKAIEFFGLTKTPWHSEDEVPYKDAVKVLSYLKDKGYRLGIIANQMPGAAERLKNWGLLEYFDVLATSAELGCAKPELRIFATALEMACCKPEEAVMVGDRIDNDIIPASVLGMKTVWVKTGLPEYCSSELHNIKPSYEINSISEIINIF